MPRAEQFTGPLTHHGEGAGWDTSAQRLRIVDMLAGDLLTIDENAMAQRLHVDTVVAAWRARVGGGIVVATAHGFALIDATGTVSARIDAFDDPRLRMNDGACDPQGRFYCGSMAYDNASGAGVLWRLDPDRSVTVVLSGLTIPNGLVWSPDGATAYHVDTPDGRIVAYDADPVAGGLHGRRDVAVVHGGDPDGMTIDAEGCLWVALWGGSAVHRYTTEGVLTEVVDVGARNVTSCAFGGPGLRRLYITTSREGVGPDDDPAAGSVFVLDVDVAGLPLHRFDG